MKISLEELLYISNESVLKDYHYSDGRIRLRIEIDELDSDIILSANTNCLALNIPEQNNLASRTCHLELVYLSEILDTENGIFVPKSNFGDFMQQNRQHLNLAFGLKQTDYQFMLSLTGSYKLVSFVISNKEDVQIEYAE